MNTLTKFIGSRVAFGLAILWCAFGHYLQVWDMITTMVGFIILFVIQNTQKTHDKALHLKLDELIRSIDEANNDFRCIEENGEKKISELKERTE